jgi:cystathionine beta-lyase/cystathionine gamma-synthase
LAAGRGGPSTRAVHAGEAAAAPAWPAAAVPIYQTAPWSFGSVAELERAYAGEGAKSEGAAGERIGALYSRYGNPTVRALEEKVAALEGAEDAVAFASGMAAISTTLATLVASGQRLLAADELYGGTDGWLAWAAERQPEAAVERVPLAGLAARLEAEAAEPGEPARPPLAAVFLETPSNPLLACCDLAAVAAARRRLAEATGRAVTLVVDGTFAPPPVQQALALGADLVVHSATKLLSGHSDVTAGVVAGAAGPIAAVRRAMIVNGGCLDPHAAFLVARGVKTLALRVARQAENAERLARLAASHPAVARVHWPGDDPAGRRQMTSGGSMLALDLAGGAAAAAAFVDALEVVRIVPSLGGVETGVSIPARTSHRGLDPETRRARGIGDGLLRISCGIEDGADLEADVARGLAAAARVAEGGR